VPLDRSRASLSFSCGVCSWLPTFEPTARAFLALRTIGGASGIRPPYNVTKTIHVAMTPTFHLRGSCHDTSIHRRHSPMEPAEYLPQLHARARYTISGNPNTIPCLAAVFSHLPWRRKGRASIGDAFAARTSSPGGEAVQWPPRRSDAACICQLMRPHAGARCKSGRGMIVRKINIAPVRRLTAGVNNPGIRQRPRASASRDANGRSSLRIKLAAPDSPDRPPARGTHLSNHSYVFDSAITPRACSTPDLRQRLRASKSHGPGGERVAALENGRASVATARHGCQ